MISGALLITGNVGGHRTGCATTTGRGVVRTGGSASEPRRMMGGPAAASLTATATITGCGVTAGAAAGAAGLPVMTAACGFPHGVTAVAITTTGRGVAVTGASASEFRDVRACCGGTAGGWVQVT